jgi:hypothetical protein
VDGGRKGGEKRVLMRVRLLSNRPEFLPKRDRSHDPASFLGAEDRILRLVVFIHG